MTGGVAGKIALVTGGAKGLGEADARALAAEGAKVVLTDLDEEAGQAVADDIGSVFKAQDVTDEARWQEIIGYAGAKGAVEGMSRAIAAHCLDSGYKIRCNSIHPGTIDTPMVQNFGQQAEEAGITIPGQVDVPDPAQAGVLGHPHNIANVVVFLASDESVFITAQEFVVDDGMSMLPAPLVHELQ